MKLPLALLSLGAAALAGCTDDNGNNRNSPAVGFPCEGGSSGIEFCGTTVTIPLGIGMSGYALAAATTPANFTLDFTGTDVGLPTSGNMTVLLTDSSGNTLAASSFPWTRSGNIATASNPGAIETWLANQTVTAYNVTVTAASIPVTTHPGVNTVTVEVNYGSQVIGTATNVWMEPCGGGSPQWGDPDACL